MKLCFLRHGEADWPNWTKPDNERPLTERGRKEMKRVAKFLDRLKLFGGRDFNQPAPTCLANGRDRGRAPRD